MFNLPNLLTALNLFSGILALLFAFSARLDLSCLFILIAALCDFLDGFAARKLGVSGELGKQLDSLADMVSFGLVPGVIMFVMLIEVSDSSVQFLPEASFQSTLIKVQLYFQKLHHFDLHRGFTWLPFIALLIPILSLFRLAKFNIDTRQSDSFIGLPTPANTLFFASFPLIYYFAEWKMVAWVFQPWFMMTLIVLFSFLLVSELPLLALKFKHFRWKGNETRFSLILASGILIPILLAWSIPIIIILYLILSFLDKQIAKKEQ